MCRCFTLIFQLIQSFALFFFSKTSSAAVISFTSSCVKLCPLIKFVKIRQSILNICLKKKTNKNKMTSFCAVKPAYHMFHR